MVYNTSFLHVKLMYGGSAENIQIQFILQKKEVTHTAGIKQTPQESFFESKNSRPLLHVYNRNNFICIRKGQV